MTATEASGRSGVTGALRARQREPVSLFADTRRFDVCCNCQCTNNEAADFYFEPHLSFLGSRFHALTTGHERSNDIKDPSDNITI